MHERRGKQLRQLVDPITHQVHDSCLECIEVLPVRDDSQIGITLNVEEVVKVSVKLHARDHVHVTIAGVINDSAHLLRGESSLRGHKGIALHLNAGYRIKKVLVVFPSGKEIDLPSNLFLGGGGPWLMSTIVPRQAREGQS